MDTVVIGGGASGMMASIASANKGNNVILIEKNEKLGKKVYITGKGRCNLTNNVSINEFMQSIVTNPKFLYSALNNLSPTDTIDFFENNGLKVKTERGNRVFPLSDKASDVIKCLEKSMISLGVDVRLNTTVINVCIKYGQVSKVITDKGEIECDSVIVCTGGVSYPLTGSTGDGYNFAKNSGHTINKILPSLVGIELSGEKFKHLQGLSLKNVKIQVCKQDKRIYEDFGEMLFTHYGVSGPIILSASCLINKLNLRELTLSIDLKPALNNEVLDSRLIREFDTNKNKAISNVMPSLVPKNLVSNILNDACVSSDKPCCNITKEERKNICNSLKNLRFNISKLRPIDEAIVTCGGVNVSEINPKTMESKLVKGLFFAGEVIDVDAFTGGFNLQIAFSTGYLAGINS